MSIRSVRIEEGLWGQRQRAIRDNMLPTNSWQYVRCSLEELLSAATPAKRPIENNGVAWEANLYKLMETAALSLAQKPDPSLESKFDELVAIVGAAQQPDGYVHAHVINRMKKTTRYFWEEPWDMKPWADSNHHDGYVIGHLMEAAVAYYQATGKKTFLEIACKAADEAWNRFVQQKRPDFAGHSEIELALVELYRITGNPKHLELSREIIDRHGAKPGNSDYEQDHLPIRKQDEIRGHAVRAVMFATGVADVALETGDTDYRAAVNRLWNSATKRKMLITGGVGIRNSEGFGPDYLLNNSDELSKGPRLNVYENGCYAESCAACGLADLAQRMFLLERTSESGNVLERVLYNTILHGIALDGKSYYYTNPLSDKNRRRDQPWLCCPPNLSRTVLKAGRYAYAQTDKDIYVNLFMASQCQIQLKAGTVGLAVETNYPWDGKVKITVTPDQPARFSLHLRIPDWCRDYRFSLNGKVISRTETIRGYAVINGDWKNGDTVELDLAMPIVLMEAHPLIKDDICKVAIQRGPIVYGLEGLDNDDDPLVTLGEDPQLKAEYRPDFLGGITVIKGLSERGKPFMAIPFYTLANRELSQQEVWLPLYNKKEEAAGWAGKLYRPYKIFE